MLVVAETAVLSREHRAQVDTELGKRLAGLGDRAAAAEARKIGYRLDPGSALRRTRGASSDRSVSLRPAPDTLRAEGDARSRGQIMADALVERITGQVSAGDVPVEVSLVMTDRTMLGNDDTPAHVEDYGPIPAGLARQIVREADRAWLRRLFLAPDADSLVAMDSRRRRFDGELRRFLVLRDEVCRSPWCDAPCGTPTTSRASPTAARRARTTAKGSASGATTRRKRRAGGPGRSVSVDIRSRSPRRPVTATCPRRRTHRARDRPCFGCRDWSPTTRIRWRSDFGRWSRPADPYGVRAWERAR